MKKLVILIYAISLFSSCEEVQKEAIPSIDRVTVDWELHRFDKELHEIAEDSSNKEQLSILEGKYPKFYHLYFKHILPLKGDNGAELQENLYGFYQDSSIVELVGLTESVHGDLSEPMFELDQAFKYMKYYVPTFIAPDVYTFISEFANQIFIFPDMEKDGIGMGLDMFLGDRYPYDLMSRENSAFSSYLVRTFNSEHMVRKTMFAIIDDMVGPPPGDRLLDHMIHNGKKLYILDKVMPMTPDSIIMEYSSEQMEWVLDSELGMWAFFFDEDLFYETDMMKINKYINPSPNSPGMPDGSPGRTANYMGWQIVRAYMKKYPSTDVGDLIKLRDAQLIMDKSRYKPKRK